MLALLLTWHRRSSEGNSTTKKLMFTVLAQFYTKCFMAALLFEGETKFLYYSLLKKEDTLGKTKRFPKGHRNS